MDAFLAGLALVFQWPAIICLFLGVIFGIFIGIIPGLGVIIGLSILLPFTFGMDPVPAFALMLGMYAVTCTSDTITSIMIGVPGTSAAQATILDGFPLAQQGHAARALGAAFTVSAFGGVVGAFMLALSMPLIKPIIQSVSSPEIFMLGVLGLTMVSSVSGGSILKGLAAATLGLLMATVGYSDSGAVPRYYFGLDFLIDGLPVISVVLGLFALPELMELAIKNTSISRVATRDIEGGGILDGIKDAIKYRWLALRSSLIGTYVGILPGLGSSIVDWLAYGHAVQSAKDKSRFGQGDIRGVIAPEAANNATRGGSLVPTLAFGVPGSLGAAILLSGMLIVGLKPGPEMLTTELTTTYSMVWSIAIANIFSTLLLIVCVRHAVKIAFIPGHMLVPAIIMFVFMGAWLTGGDIGDWIVCLAMGVVGFFMKRGGWPRPPLVLALVLGPILENAFLLTTRVYGNYDWLQRPIVLCILAIIIISLFFVLRDIIRQRRRGETPDQSESATRNPIFSLPLAVLLCGIFISAVILAADWSYSVRLFPVLLGWSGVLFALFAIYQDCRALQSEVASSGGWINAVRDAGAKALFKKACQFFGYLLVMLLFMPILGQKVVLPLFIVVYLIRWGNVGWRISAIYALAAWLFMVVFYGHVMHMFWYPSWLGDFLSGSLPAWAPVWLFF